MRHTIAILLFFSGYCAAQPTVSRVRAKFLEHGSVTILSDASSTPAALRVRYAVDPAPCDDAGGVTLESQSSPHLRYAARQNITALAPSTTYNVCVQASSGGGVWSTIDGDDDVQITTPAASGGHPENPIAPETFTAAYPDTTGYTVVTLSSCSTLQTELNSATGRQDTVGTVIKIDPGVVCNGNYTINNGTDARTVTYNNETEVWSLTSHGFNDGDQVYLASSTGFLPGGSIWPYTSDWEGVWTHGGYMGGRRYYVINKTDHTFQLSETAGGDPVEVEWIEFTASDTADTITILPDFEWPYGVNLDFASGGTALLRFRSSTTLPAGLSAGTTYYALSNCTRANSPCSFQVSTTPGGSIVDITDTGTGTHKLGTVGEGTMTVRPVANPKWIVIRTSAADSELPPEGVRITPEWISKMPIFRQDGMAAVPSTFTMNEGAHNIRFVGTRHTHNSNTDYLTTYDTRPYRNFYEGKQSNSGIVFDRAYIHGVGYPQRMMVGMYIEGSMFAIKDSYIDKIEAWSGTLTNPYVSNRAVNLSYTSNSVSLGQFKLVFNGTVAADSPSATSIAITGGSATGTCYVYLTVNGTLNVQCPTGTTATCTPGGSFACSVSTAASPGWPTSGGRDTAKRFMTFALSAGAVTGVSNQGDSYVSLDSAAPAGTIIGGYGPGPYLIENNYISGAGVVLHFDDTGKANRRGDYMIRRNKWVVPDYTMWGHADNNGTRSFHRHSLEFKSGQRIEITGNDFRGNYVDVTGVSSNIAFTAVANGRISDINVHHNYFEDAGTMVGMASTGALWSPAVVRQKFSHNIFNINGWGNVIQSIDPELPGRGWTFYGALSIADVQMDHNTTYNSRGLFGHWFNMNGHAPTEGMSIKNNVFLNNAYGGVFVDGTGCGGVRVNKAIMDCNWPGYTFSGNVALPNYSNNQAGTGSYSFSSTCTSFGGSWSDPNCSGSILARLGTEAEVSDRLAALKYVDPANENYDLRHDSPLISGGGLSTDGLGVGADYNAVRQAIGTIYNQRALSITDTGATIYATVPDLSVACKVGYGTTSDPTTWTWSSANTDTSRVRGIALTGLSSATTYHYRMVCAGTYQPATQTFTTATP